MTAPTQVLYAARLRGRYERSIQMVADLMEQGWTVDATTPGCFLLYAP